MRAGRRKVDAAAVRRERVLPSPHEKEMREILLFVRDVPREKDEAFRLHMRADDARVALPLDVPEALCRGIGIDEFGVRERFGKEPAALQDRLLMRKDAAHIPERGALPRDETVFDGQDIFLHGKQLFVRIEKVEVLRHRPLQGVFDGQHRAVRLPRVQGRDRFKKAPARHIFRFGTESARRKAGITPFRAEISDLFFAAHSFSPLHLVGDVEDEPLRIRPAEAGVGDGFAVDDVLLLAAFLYKALDHEALDVLFVFFVFYCPFM